MTNKRLNSKGFTLLEILLVVGIISILAGIVIIAINPGRQLAKVRDTERRVGVSEINKALSQYYIDNGHFPSDLTNEVKGICVTGSSASSTVDNISCADSVDFSSLVPIYLPSIPTDPTGVGYQVGLSQSGKPMLIAPLTESGPPIIAVGTTTEAVTKYIVTFNNQGGNPDFSTSTGIIFGATTTLPNAPTKPGYIFSGWYIDVNYGVQFTTNTSITSNLTVYAKWIDACEVSGTVADLDCWSAVSSNTMTWGPMGIATNASSTSNGSLNTYILSNLSGVYPAADYCANLTENTLPRGTWYLPAVNQLKAAQSAGVSGFYPAYTWSSTEDYPPFNGNYAMFVKVGVDYTYAPVSKGGGLLSVRCLR